MSSPSDLVPVSDRLRGIQLVRLLLAIVVIAGAGLHAGAAADLVGLALVYAAVTAGFEVARRLTVQRGVALASTTLALDGLFLAVVVGSTGGATSPLLFLIHLHIVAVVLLVTFRSGIVVAVWHALLLVASSHPAWPSGHATAQGWVVALAGASFVVAAAVVVRAESINEDTLRRSRRSAAILFDLGNELERATDPVEVCWRSACALRRGLSLDRVVVLTGDPHRWQGVVASETTVLVASRSATIDITSQDEDGATIDVAAAGGASLSDVVDTLMPHADVVVPVRSSVVEVGIVGVDLGDRRVGDHEIHVLERAASRIVLALRTAELHAETERLATLDGLTGLSNRRTFDDVLTRAVAGATRVDATLALAMIDVDHFKQVNDTYGHPTGDEVLRQLAAALVDASRSDSVVARYGGEEFAVILWCADHDGAAVAAERLRGAARAVTVVPVTVSVGVASLEPGMDPASLVTRADRALYEAKARGRDRVATALGSIDRSG